MTTKQVSIEDFPRLIPGVQFWAGHSPCIIPHVLLTSRAYEKEMRSEVVINPAAKPPSEKMRCTHGNRQSPAAHVLVSDKLISAARVMRGWCIPSERGFVNKCHCHFARAFLTVSFLSLMIFDAALQYLVCNVAYEEMCHFIFGSPLGLDRREPLHHPTQSRHIHTLLGSPCPSRFASN